MKLASFIVLLAPLALFACSSGSDGEPDSQDAPGPGEAPAAGEAPAIGVARSELRAVDDSKYCLPGEVKKCTLGPPPVCTCVVATATRPAFGYSVMTQAR